MGWAVGFDSNHNRDIGYGVPAICDHPECSAVIDRGLSYVCGNDVYGGERGCGLFFCADHLSGECLCERCQSGGEHFALKPDVAEWIEWKLSDESWQRWRDENPDKVMVLREQIKTAVEWIEIPKFLRRNDD